MRSAPIERLPALHTKGVPSAPRRLLPWEERGLHFFKINRDIELIELLVSHSKQRPGHQINRNISRPPRARKEVFSSHSPLACPDAGREQMRTITRHCLFNRHSFLIGIAVSYRKQRPGQNLMATKTPFFTHPFSPLSFPQNPIPNTLNPASRPNPLTPRTSFPLEWLASPDGPKSRETAATRRPRCPHPPEPTSSTSIPFSPTRKSSRARLRASSWTSRSSPSSSNTIAKENFRCSSSRKWPISASLAPA